MTNQTTPNEGQANDVFNQDSVEATNQPIRRSKADIKHMSPGERIMWTEICQLRSKNKQLEVNRLEVEQEIIRNRKLYDEIRGLYERAVATIKNRNVTIQNLKKPDRRTKKWVSAPTHSDNSKYGDREYDTDHQF